MQNRENQKYEQTEAYFEKFEGAKKGNQVHMRLNQFDILLYN